MSFPSPYIQKRDKVNHELKQAKRPIGNHGSIKPSSRRASFLLSQLLTLCGLPYAEIDSLFPSQAISLRLAFGIGGEPKVGGSLPFHSPHTRKTAVAHPFAVDHQPLESRIAHSVSRCQRSRHILLWLRPDLGWIASLLSFHREVQSPMFLAKFGCQASA